MFTYLQPLSSVQKSCVYVVGVLISPTVDTASFEWVLHAWIQAAWTQSTVTLRKNGRKIFNHKLFPPAMLRAKKGGLLIGVKQTYQPSSAK